MKSAPVVLTTDLMGHGSTKVKILKKELGAEDYYNPLFGAQLMEGPLRGMVHRDRRFHHDHSWTGVVLRSCMARTTTILACSGYLPNRRGDGWMFHTGDSSQTWRHLREGLRRYNTRSAQSIWQTLADMHSRVSTWLGRIPTLYYAMDSGSSNDCSPRTYECNSVEWAPPSTLGKNGWWYLGAKLSNQRGTILGDSDTCWICGECGPNIVSEAVEMEFTVVLKALRNF